MATAPTVEVLLPGFPIATDQGEIGFCGVTLIRGSDGSGRPRNIIVDAAHVGRRGWLVRALAMRRLSTTDVHGLVLSHAHWDHMQNIDLFPEADIFLHPDERRYIRSPHPDDEATPGWTSAVIERQHVKPVTEGAELIPGVHILDAPGHSAGSIAVAVQTHDGLAVVSGDAIQTAAVAAERRNKMVFWNVEQADRTVEKLVSVADMIYPGHDQPFRLDGHRVTYLEPFALNVKNLERDQPGLTFQPSGSEGRWVMPRIESQRLANP